MTDFPFTLIEMRMGKDGKGEGKILAATAVSVKNGRLELQAYGSEPAKLTTITESQKVSKLRIPANLIAHSGHSDHFIGAERRFSDPCLYLRA